MSTDCDNYGETTCGSPHIRSGSDCSSRLLSPHHRRGGGGNENDGAVEEGELEKNGVAHMELKNGTLTLTGIQGMTMNLANVSFWLLEYSMGGGEIGGGVTKIVVENASEVVTLNSGKQYQFAFENFTKLQTVELEQSVKSIGEGVFKNVKTLETINLHYVETIGKEAFSGCTGLSSADLAHATKLGYGAFKNCTSLTSADVLALTSEASFEYRPFDGCSKLNTVNVTVSLDTGLIKPLFGGTPLENSEACKQVSDRRELIPRLQDAVNNDYGINTEIVVLRDLDLRNTGVNIGKSIVLFLNNRRLTADEGPAITIDADRVSLYGADTRAQMFDDGGTIEVKSGNAVLVKSGNLRIFGGTYSSSSGQAIGTAFTDAGPATIIQIVGGIFTEGNGISRIGKIDTASGTSGRIMKTAGVSLDPPDQYYKWKDNGNGYQVLTRQTWVEFSVGEGVDFTKGAGLDSLALDSSGRGSIAVENGTTIGFSAIAKDGYRKLKVESGIPATESGNVYSIDVGTAESISVDIGATRMYTVTFSNSSDVKFYKGTLPGTEYEWNEDANIAYVVPGGSLKFMTEAPNGRIVVDSPYSSINGDHGSEYETTVTIGSDGEVKIKGEYRVELSLVENGSVTSNKDWYAYGEIVQLRFYPDTGYKLEEWSWRSQDGQNYETITTGRPMTSMTAGGMTVEVSFVKEVYSILKSNPEGATLEVQETAHYGDVVRVVGSCEEGYTMIGVRVFGSSEPVDVGEGQNGYEFVMPAEDVTLTAVTARLHTVTFVCPADAQITLGGGLSLTDEGTVTVEESTMIQFITATKSKTGRTVLKSSEYGIDQTTDGPEYRMSLVVDSDGTVSVKTQYKVTLQTVPHGKITADKVWYDNGEQVVLTLEPDEGYRAVQYSWERNGTTVGVAGFDGSRPARITMNGADIDVSASFLSRTYNISASHPDSGGTVVVPSSAEYGTKVEFTATPDKGYEARVVIEDVYVQPDPADPTKYTFRMPAHDVGVKIDFEAKRYAITIEEAEHTRVVSTLVDSARYKDILRFKVETDDGYSEHLEVYFDGKQVSPDSSGAYSVTMPYNDVVLRTETSVSVYTVNFTIGEHTRLRFDGDSEDRTESFHREYTHGETLAFRCSTDTGYDRAFKLIIGGTAVSSREYSEPVRSSMDLILSTEVNKYIITWVDENGTELYRDEAAPYGMDPDYKGSRPTKAEDEARTYTWIGWNPKVEPVVEDRVYTANYEGNLKDYTVTWRDWNGDVLESRTVKYGEFPERANLERDPDEMYEYEFKGWSPSPSKVTGNVTYDPVYKQTDRLYTVIWKDHDQKELKREQLKFGDTPDYGDGPERAPDKEHVYSFDHWQPTVTDVRNDAEYQAVYKAKDREYKIVFNKLDGAEFVRPAGFSFSEKYHSRVEFAIVPTTTHIEVLDVMIGWESGSRPLYPDDSGIYSFEVEGDTVVSATTSPDEHMVFIIGEGITVMNGDIEVVEGGRVRHGDVLIVTIASKAGHDAEVTSDVGTIGSDGTYSVETDVTFTGKYTPVIYAVKWLADDGSIIRTDPVAYGVLPAAPESPIKESDESATYEFAGWSPSVTAVTGDATYTATYNKIPKKYTIRWLNDDGILLYSSSVEYGVVPGFVGEDPQKVQDARYRYEWRGWTPEVVPVTGDETYTADYQAVERTYAVRWTDWDGSVLLSDDYPYGTTPVYRGPAPERGGHTFAGWSPSVTAVTGDAVYTATYSASGQSCTVTIRGEGVVVMDGPTRIVDGGAVPAGTVLTVTMEQRDGLAAVLTASVGAVASDGSYTVSEDVSFTGSYTRSAVAGGDDDGGFPWWILIVLAIIIACLVYRHHRDSGRD